MSARPARSHRRFRTIAAALTLLLSAGLAMPVAGHAAPDDGLTVIDQVGFFTVSRSDGKPSASFLSQDYDGGNETSVPAAKALLHLPSTSLTTVPHDDYAYDHDGIDEPGPEDSFYAFLGPEGTSIYRSALDPADAQATQNVALGYAGSADVEDGEHAGTVRLQSVDGPGRTYRYSDTPSEDGTGPGYRALHWDLSRPAGVDNLYGEASAAEDRYFAYSAFSAPGEYCLRIRPEVNAYAGGTETGDSAAVRVVVGDRTPEQLAATAPCPQPERETPTGPTDPNAPFVFQAGMHVDLAGVLQNGGPLSLTLRKTDAAGGKNESLHPFADSVVSVPDYARTTIPTREQAGGTDTSFLGTPGRPTWRIPELYDTNRVWMGFGGELIDDPVASSPILRMTGVTGADGGPAPGELVVWNSNGPERGYSPTYSTRQGLPAGAYVAVGSHGHRNWDFSAPGVYCVGFDLQVARENGTQLRDKQVMTVVVGDQVDPASVTPCGRSGRPLPVGVPARTPVVATAGQAKTFVGTSADNSARTGFTSLTTSLSGAGELRTRLVEGSVSGPGTSYDPDDVVFRAAQDDNPNPDAEAGPVGQRLWSLGSNSGDGYGTLLTFDSLGVEPEQLDGPLTWELSALRGPGTLRIRDGYTHQLILSGKQGSAPASAALVPGRAEKRFQLHLDTTGVYCADLRYSGRRASDGATVSDTTTLTLVAGATPADVRPCSQGQQPTAPSSEIGQPPVPTDPGTPGTRPSSGRAVLRTGHVDVRTDLTTTSATTRVQDDATEPATDRDPARTTFYAAPGARTTVPAGSTYAFLGTPGSPTWILPQTQDPNLLWPGWNVDLGDSSASAVRWTLNSVRGPGRFALFENTGFGGVKLLLDSTGTAHRTFDYSAHAHGNWAFSSDGVYCLTSTFGSRPTGPGDDATLLFAVGDVDPAVVTPADCGKTAAAVRQETGTPPSSPAPPSAPTAGTGTTSPALPGLNGTGTPVPRAAPTARNQACLPTPVTTTRPAAVSVVSDGHLDFGSRVLRGTLQAAIKDDRASPTVWRDPASLVLDVGAKAKHSVPAGYGFLGRTGAPVWIIPQTQVAGVPWLGWNTQHETLRSAGAGPVTFTLTGMSGPGRLAVYTDGTFGGVQDKVFGTAPGFPRSFRVPIGVHAHANWAFTAAGVYRLAMTQTTTLPGGRTSSSTGTLSVAIGQADPRIAAPSVRSTDYTGRTADGDSCHLSVDARANALASTGADVVDALVTGLLLLLGAAVALAAGRRRRVRA